MTYPQGPYAPPPGGAPGGYIPPPGGAGFGAAPASNGIAIAALIVGIISLLFALIPVVGWFSVPFAIGAIGMGVAGLSRAKSANTGRGLAIGGIVTGVLALLASVVWTVLLVVVADDVDSDINSDPSDGVCNRDRFLEDPDC